MWSAVRHWGPVQVCAGLTGHFWDTNFWVPNPPAPPPPVKHSPARTPYPNAVSSQEYKDPNFRSQLPHLIIGDPAFVSTTLDVDVATGIDFGGICVFSIRGETGPPVPRSFQGTGANVDWVSQYPCEAERLLPSNTLFIPDPLRKGQAAYERDPRFQGHTVCEGPPPPALR